MNIPGMKNANNYIGIYLSYDMLGIVFVVVEI